jgi:hypothetical protein
MGDLLKLIWYAVVGPLRSRAALQTEVLALRHQLNVLRRRAPKRATVSNIDRLVFAGFYHLASEALDAVKILEPETIIRWHRAGFEPGGALNHGRAAASSAPVATPRREEQGSGGNSEVTAAAPRKTERPSQPEEAHCRRFRYLTARRHTACLGAEINNLDARDLMAPPKCPLLDEPTLGLAPVIVDEISETIKRLARSSLSTLLGEQNAVRR